jgi:hypothetical protein
MLYLPIARHLPMIRAIQEWYQIVPVRIKPKLAADPAGR